MWITNCLWYNINDLEVFTIYNIILLIIAYLVGSIPFSVIIGKVFHKIDIRDFGSGNPGATNSIRHLGKRTGIIVLLLDAFKSASFIFLIKYGVIDFENILHPCIFGSVAVLGHVLPIFLKFKGGKGVASGLGLVMAYNPIVAIIGLVGFYLAVKITKYVSIGSCVSGITMITGTFIYGILVSNDILTNVINDRYPDQPFMFFYCGTLMLSIVMFRHKGNFKKILNGTETKISSK